ncbi:CUB domain-containing protein [Hanstruepera marina]|uniref:CUB domain-containing protein n=1 Tax=Hanstruepera marina TaxID=2873265 RepID=UPI001CA76624|nr:CUB domain-containing protein [Hanstruepera marina]
MAFNYSLLKSIKNLFSLKVLILSFIFVLSSLSSYGQDDPCSATAIALTPLGTTCIVGDNTGATDSSNPNIDTPVGCEPVSANYAGEDVWFSVIVGTTGNIQVDLTHIPASSFFDGVIALYTGSCSGALTIVECDDDSGVGLYEPSFTAFGLTPGDTVYIRVWHWDWGGNTTGTFDICVTEITNPCDSVIPINSTCGSTQITATIPSGTGIFNDTCNDAPGDEQIFSFTPATTGSYTITQISSAVGHVNYSYGTSCASDRWTCIDDLTSNGTTSSFTLTAGTLYYFYLDTETATGGNVVFTIDCPPPPPVCSSQFFDSGGSSGNYANNETDVTTTIFPANAGDAVTVTFNSFNTEAGYDYLTVYDGPNSTYPSLGSYSGTTIPGPFTSSDPSGALTFVFNSDGFTTAAGWNANVTCGPVISCGETYVDRGGISGNYSSNSDEITTIAPNNPGEVVTVTFSVFDLHSSDTMRVYDGPNIGAPLIGSYNGNTIPGPFTSTDPSGALTFRFQSGRFDNAPGWVADVRCDCFITITETLNPIGADACSLNYAELTATPSNSNIPTTIWSDDFSSGISAWSAVNFSSTNGQWISSNSTDAGGTANEATLDWITGYADGEWVLTSPAINIASYTNLEIDLRHYLNSWIPSTFVHSIFIETSIDNTNWTAQWSQDPVTGDIAANALNLDISALDGNPTLYIRFRFDGEIFGIFNWAIDDVVVSGTPPATTPSITWTPATGLYTDASLTTPYVLGTNFATVYAAPNGTETYTATDQEGCFNTVTVSRNKKVWNGSQNTSWYVDDNWTPSGVPTSTDCILIPDVANSNNRSPIADITNTAPLPPQPAYGLNLIIETNGYLEIESNTSLVVTDWIQLDGTIDVRDSGSIIQINEGAPNVNNNTGSGVMNMQRTVPTGVNGYDYIYWSSPTDEDFNVTDISSATGELIYEWNPTLDGIIHGDWIPASGIMQRGKGYIVRGLVSTNPVPANTAQFSGRPQNGVVTVPITRGTHNSGNYTSQGDALATNEDDNWNLIGNPYPSAVSYTDFISANSFIDGTIYFWTHQTGPVFQNSPFYYDFIYNYSDDYIDNNYTGSNPPGFNGDIAAGQAFFVLMLDSPAAGTSENITFNNTMRDETLNNSQFYRTNNTRQSNIERHRIWLDLINANELATSILVGYVEGATNNKDRLYDGYDFAGSAISFYSLITNEKMSIQGRALPFDVTDMVSLGIEIPTAGNYSIAINSLDGLFENEEQNIYLEDTYTNFIHDLRLSPYSFTAETGVFNDRFILRYTNNSLGVDEFSSETAITITAPGNHYIKVKASNSPIQSIVVYDVLGRQLYNNNAVNQLEFRIDNLSQSDGVLFVKAELENGIQKVQKVILKH